MIGVTSCIAIDGIGAICAPTRNVYSGQSVSTDVGYLVYNKLIIYTILVPLNFQFTN